MGPPDVSVVIPTWNRRARLARVLGALAAQDHPPERIEVVVVDDGSTDGTAGQLGASAYPFSLRVERQENAGPAAARNRGIAAASAGLVLFLDDDVVPAPGLVAAHLRHHRAARDLAVLGPMASLPGYAQPWVAWEQAMLEKQYRALERGEYAATYRQFWTGNASAPRDALLGAGGFDAAFRRAEDVELGQRLAARGLSFRYEPRARGVHHAERSLAAWEAAQRAYGRLEVRIFEREGEGALLRILSGNYRAQHPALRATVRAVRHRQGARLALVRALRALLVAAERAGEQRASLRACSLLAALHYWSESERALGEARASLVFGGAA